jgi:hypothetical protein
MVDDDLQPGATVTDERQQPTTMPAETSAALTAQIADVRDVLRADAAAVGIGTDHVDAAVDTALAGYADARVHGFIGVLVERDVRAALRLRQLGAAGDGARREAAGP